MNKDPQNVRIPLKGLAIGDEICDPIHQMSYGDFLFQTGFVDENDRDVLRNMSRLTLKVLPRAAVSRMRDLSHFPPIFLRWNIAKNSPTNTPTY